LLISLFVYYHYRDFAAALGATPDGRRAGDLISPGISPSLRHKLFKEMTTSKGAQGTGLGLYISNAVVHGKFNGNMWCEDNPGGGAIFGMTIPLKSTVSADDISDIPTPDQLDEESR